jgi:DNA polymerase-1
LSVDFQQLQLAIFAQLSGEAAMSAALKAGEDLHSFTARQIYNLPPTTKPDKGQRTIGKNINFGFVFGAGEKKMQASTAGVKGLKRLLSLRFPHAVDFINKNMRDASTLGYVLTPGGYPLQVPSDREYAATNFIIQGAEGEVVKRAMVLLFFDLFASVPAPERPSMLLQVHDELVFRIPWTQVSMIPRIKETMRSAGSYFGLHLDVDATIHLDNWSEGIACPDSLLHSIAQLHLPAHQPTVNRQILRNILNSSTISI